MAKYLGKRIFYIILTLFIVSTITFFLMKLMPGTPLTNQAKLTPTQIHQIYKQYGLDKPVWQQYLAYLGGIIHGNFGTSFQFSNQPVSYLISSRLGPSLIIGGQGMVLGVLAGLVVGAVGAIKANTWVDTSATIISILFISIPSFVLAVLLQYYLGLKLRLFPIADWGGFMYTVLPTLALAASPLAETARFMRTEMVDVLSSDYIELAKAKALNQFLGDFAKEISSIGRSSSRQSLVKLSVSSHFDHEREGELLPAVDAYEAATCKFCGRTEKLKPLPKYVGAFCAFCGERL